MGIKVNLISNPKNRVSINKQDRTTIRTVGISPVNGSEIEGIYDQANLASQIAISSYNYANGVNSNIITQLVGLKDVDATSLDNNETLVYDDVSGKFIVKELPNINGGTF